MLGRSPPSRVVEATIRCVQPRVTASSGVPASAPASEATVGQGAVHANKASASSPIRHMLVRKTCKDIDHCTVVESEAGPIPVETEAFYTGPLLERRTTSGVILTTPAGDTATGHCSLNYNTGLGTCVFTQRNRGVGGISCQSESNIRVFGRASERLVHLGWNVSLRRSRLSHKVLQDRDGRLSSRPARRRLSASTRATEERAAASPFVLCQRNDTRNDTRRECLPRRLTEVRVPLAGRLRRAEVSRSDSTLAEIRQAGRDQPAPARCCG